MAGIFISYRRGDAPGLAGHLADELAMRFGEDSVFSDIDAIEPGVDFVESIERVVDGADVVLVVIGRDWLVERDRSGRRRIDNPEDYVRLEIAAALARDTRVIPVLVNGAEMPRSEDLPDELQSLARRSALEIRDASWQYDLERLVRALEDIDRPHRAAPAGRIRPRWPRRVRRSTARRRSGRGGSMKRPPPPPMSMPGPTHAPESAVKETPLHTMFQEAALAGVVSEAVATSLQEASGTVERGTPPSDAWTYRDVGEARDHQETYFPRAERVQLAHRPRLVWAVLPLALLGAGFVVAKWLLGWFVEGGEPVEGGAPAQAPEDVVACTVFAPPSAAPGEMILVQAFAHLPEDAGEAAANAMVFDSEAVMRTYQSLEMPVRLGSRLQFELQMPPGFEVEDPVASLIWRRKPAAVQFDVRIPKRTRERTVIGTLHIHLESVPIGRVKFKLGIDRDAGQVPSEPRGEHAQRYTVAFISYASADRAHVLPIVRGLSAAGVRYFQDVLSLEPGDRWEQKLELGIDECDLFMLFWSNEAKKSKWVRREVRYALERQAGDEVAPPEITPIPIEDPPPRPWRELKHLHHNDRLLYLLRPPSRR